MSPDNPAYPDRDAGGSESRVAPDLLRGEERPRPPAPPDALDQKIADAWNRRVDTFEPGWNACPGCGFSLGAYPEMCDTCAEWCES